MRDNFSPAVKRIVAERVNYCCSNPSCRAQTSGPQIDPSKSLNVGVAAHITAASPGGPRYNHTFSPEERRDANNAIWLCQNCAKLVDNDASRFTEDELRQWKDTAEAEALARVGKSATSTDSYLSISSKTELKISIEEIRERVRDATSELTENWYGSRRLTGKPLIKLQVKTVGQEDNSGEQLLNLENIHEFLQQGQRIVLEAPAGRGKTTTLIQLAKIVDERGGLSFLIDLPLWAKTKSEILDFIAGRREFLAQGITAGDLARLYQAERFSFLLNGWNEVSETYYEDAVVAVRELDRSFPGSGIIVATRTRHTSPPLPGANRAQLLSLSRAQRNEYLREASGKQAELLESILENNPVLDALTRTPLFLSEVTTIFKLGGPIPTTKMGVLSAVLHLVDQSDDHRDYLQQAPLMGHAPDYLAELAIQMITRGDSTILEKDARPIVKSVSVKLKDSGQIVKVPEPVFVLNTLCDHHILERLDSQPAAFRFEHQQFQEFYAANHLKLLLNIIRDGSRDQHQEFVKQYVNMPAWDEPLRMIAEEIKMLSNEAHTENDAVSAGKLLIETALSVDPVFAGELSRLCGEKVWKEVRHIVSERLRLWYSVEDRNHQQCALAGMLATGSEDFIDIILPLLTNDDKQVRLHTYRAGTEFHPSSLGANWRNVVKGWSEEARIEFIHELTIYRWKPEIADVFALADPSPKVRAEAIKALSWSGSDSDIVRIFGALDNESFEEAIKNLAVERIPPQLRQRALLTYRKLLNKSTDVINHLKLLTGAEILGDPSISEKLKEELTQLPLGKIDYHVSEYVIKPAITPLLRTDRQWVSHWIARRIADGTLRPEEWIKLVISIPEDLKENLLYGIKAEDIQQISTSGIALLLPVIADAMLAETIFSRLCEIRRSITDVAGAQNESKRTILRQLEDLFRSLPPNVAVEGLSNCFAKEYDAIEFTTVIEVFSRTDSKYPDLRSQLQDNLRKRLRTYLKNGLQFALTQDDFRGEMKAHLATVIARIGEPGDMSDLQELTKAELERFRKGRSALAQGDRSELAKGGSVSYSHWHLNAVATLDPEEAEAVLLDALQKPEHEIDAASSLVRLATNRRTGGLFGHNERDYCLIWEARAGDRHQDFDEERSRRYALAIKERISVLLEERASSTQIGAFDYKLIELANFLAALGSNDSTDVVLQVISLPAKFFAWRRVEALENLLFSGAILPAETTLSILNPIIESIFNESWLYNNQGAWLLMRCLCLLIFVDAPAAGIERVRQVVFDKDFPRYELRGLMHALGCSRSPEALRLLRDIASKGGWLEHIIGEWIKAVASLRIPEAAQLLLSFIETGSDEFEIEMDLGSYHGDLLASHIVNIAKGTPAIKHRIFYLCAAQRSPEKLALLSKVVAQLKTTEAVLAGLNLIDDTVTSDHTATSPVPYDLREAIERTFLEQRPNSKTGSSYTLIPRSAKVIRTQLFDMALNDDRRRLSAFSLLGQIEVWRLEYGRPNTEPRHPAFDSGEAWPPLKTVNLLSKKVHGE